MENKEQQIKILENYKFSWVTGEGEYDRKVPDGVVNLHEIANIINSDQDVKTLTEKYRRYGDDQDKKKLPRFFPAGIFDKINKTGFLQKASLNYTWLVPFDFDLKDNPTFWDVPNWIDVLPKYSTPKCKEVFETIICSDPNVLLAFYSPSGGFKGLVMCKPESFKIKSGNKELATETIKNDIYPLLEQRWGIKLDPAQSMVHMGMHLAHMENPHVNLDCKPLHVNIHLNLRNQKHKTPDNKNEVFEEYLDRFTNQSTNKWYDFTYMAYKTGQNVASKWWGTESLSQLLAAVERNGDIKDLNAARKAITESYNEGLENPLDPELLHDKKTAKLYHAAQLRYLRTQRINDYVRIGTKYYHIDHKVNDKTGFLEEVRIPWDKDTINDDYGRGANKEVTKYKGFENNPDYFRKIRHSGSYFNLFHPLKWSPVEGNIEHSINFVKHIFQEQFEDGLDLMKLWYLYPKQKTHVLCLLSEENETGKTTFFQWLSYMFGHDNVTIMASEDFASNFNHIWVTSNFICIDEGKLGQSKIDLGKKLRIWTTSEKGYLEEKHKNKEKIDFHGRFMVASNEVKRFLKINQNDNRYWLRQVPRFKSFDPKFLQNLIDEIPYFLYFLQQRDFKNKIETGKSRFGLPHSVINTTIRDMVIEHSEDNMYHFILEYLKDWFAKNSEKEYFNATITEWKDDILKYQGRFETKWFKETIEKFNPDPQPENAITREGPLREFYRSSERWICIPRESVYPNKEKGGLW